MNDYLRAPFPYFGGKTQAAALVWSALGDVEVYVEPFAGSCAALLMRPERHRRRVETVNDADGLLSNAWRGIQLAPEETARHADWPVSEADLHARHIWLVQHRESVTEQLCADPDWCDPRAAGWWIWGACCWIGSGWCSGNGPWTVEDGRLVKRTDSGGVSRQRPHLADDGRGVHRPPWAAVGSASIRQWFEVLSKRLRHVRVCCGDWSRVCTPAGTHEHLQCRNGGTCGMFLDPPYSQAERRSDLYAVDRDVAAAVRAWCLEHTATQRLRVVLAGYEDEGHEPLEAAGWRVVSWKGRGMLSGGYRGRGQKSAKTQTNTRERLWLSPGCLTEQAEAQLDMWAPGGEAGGG
jgi:DNA adenine methylase